MSRQYYESYDIPKGTLRGAPLAPSHDLTSLRVSYFLVANKSVSADDITDLTQSLVDVRSDLLSQYPILAQAAAPSTDANALIPIHPGATYYNGNQQSFLDKYDDKLYYGSLLLGSLISIVIAAWRFAGSGGRSQSSIEPLYELGNEIKGAKNEAELEQIEKRIDDMLKAELSRNASGDDADSNDMAALGLAAHRLQHLMNHRRTLLRAHEPAAAQGTSRNTLTGRSIGGRAPGKHRILYLNQCRRRLYPCDLVRSLTASNKPREPDLAIGVIGVALAISPVQGGADPLCLINACHCLRLVQVANKPVAFFVDIRRDLVRNLASIAAKGDPAVESGRSKPDGSRIGSI